MGSELKFEVWDTKNDDRGYWIMRSDGMCWEYLHGTAVPPRLLGNIYIPGRDILRCWERVRPSEYPRLIQNWLNHHQTQPN